MQRPAACYLCKLPDIPGKFQVAKVRRTCTVNVHPHLSAGYIFWTSAVQAGHLEIILEPSCTRHAVHHACLEPLLHLRAALHL